jgi:hypothetical protein
MATIESYVQPKYLYRYRSLDTPKKIDSELDAIEQAYLFCVPFRSLNDPMEGVWGPTSSLRGQTRYRELRSEINDHKTRLRICSFSEVYNHELMWAHYADQFKGICIRFDLSKLLKRLTNDAAFVRMFYNEHRPLMHSTDTNPHELARRALSSKSYRWLYEREWRLFAPQGKACYRAADTVQCVFLGSRIENRVERQVRERVAEVGIPVRAMSIKKYTIQFEEEEVLS